MSKSISSSNLKKNLASKTKPKKQERMSLEEFRNQGLDPKGENSKQRKNKFGAIPKTVDGIRFHSTWEADRYSQLKIQERIGEISELKLQVPYNLEVNGMLVTKYIADFTYVHVANGFIVEDAKGFKTPEYKIKRNLMEAVHGIILYESYRVPKSPNKRSKR